MGLGRVEGGVAHDEAGEALGVVVGSISERGYGDEWRGRGVQEEHDAGGEGGIGLDIEGGGFQRIPVDVSAYEGPAWVGGAGEEGKDAA